MPQVCFENRRCDHQHLRRFCESLFIAGGLAASDARLVTESLVESNLRGIDSHGVARIPHYLARIRTGSINPRPNIRTEILSPAAARVDGDHGLGQLVMHSATMTAIQRAKEAGAGWVAVANSSHCGALHYYGLKIAEEGMIGLVFTHVDPMVVPHGSWKPFCGTNPICITAPRTAGPAGDSENGALCLDMATSIAPWNAVANAACEGVPIPEGWGLDELGKPTTQADRTVALNPFGSYKGSGLGLMIDVLCAMLSNSPFGPDIPKMYDQDLTKHRRLGGLVGAIDIGRFVPLTRFHERIAALIARWGAMPTVEGCEKVLFPGEPELIERRRRLVEGIPVGVQMLKEFDQLAERFGLAKLEAGVESSGGVPRTHLSSLCADGKDLSRTSV
jgi:ureidoglycolate dehydrogenase (NAD+)